MKYIYKKVQEMVTNATSLENFQKLKGYHTGLEMGLALKF